MWGTTCKYKTEDIVLRFNITFVLVNRELCLSTHLLKWGNSFDHRFKKMTSEQFFWGLLSLIICSIRHAIFETDQLWVVSSFETILAAFCHSSFGQRKDKPDSTFVAEQSICFSKILYNKHRKQERIKQLNLFSSSFFSLKFKDTMKPSASASASTLA